MDQTIPNGLKILYIITQADGGGAQKYTLALAKAFNGSIAAGDEARQLFEAAERQQTATYKLQHLKRQISPWHDFLAVWEMRQLIKNLNPDIVHLNSSKAGILGSFAAIGLKKKVIFTAHGFIFNEPLSAPIKNFYLALEKTASDFRDYIICVSEADKNSAMQNGLIKAEKITAIHNGIGQINFLEKQQARAELGLSHNKIIIGCVANFYKTKGLDILIAAVAQMEESLRQKIEVVITGTGPELQNCRSQIKNLRLEKNFNLLEKTENIAKYIKAFDVFVMPSRKEGFSFALLEAMQAGLPIVASNVGGLSEALGDCGFLVKPEDPRELSLALSRIINDINAHGPSYFNELSKKVRQRSELFTDLKMLEQTKKVYQFVLSR